MITVDFDCLGLRAGSRILDIGCGSGRHTAAAFDLQKGWVLGADRDFDDLQQAHERLCLHASLCSKGRFGWALAGADITHLPFSDASFDLVICSEVLEHVPDHHTAIHECFRVLKPRGQLVVSVPRQWPETICWALSAQYRHSPGGHIRIYNKNRLVRMIQGITGLSLHKVHHAHSLHTPYWWLKCLLDPDDDTIWAVRQYHRLLTWDMMSKPPLTRRLERWFNPILGKSVVLYFTGKGLTAVNHDPTHLCVN